MNIFVVLVVTNLLTILGAMGSGYEAHEVAAFAALNIATIGTSTVFVMLISMRRSYMELTGEKNDRKVE